MPISQRLPGCGTILEAGGSVRQVLPPTPFAQADNYRSGDDEMLFMNHSHVKNSTHSSVQSSMCIRFGYRIASLDRFFSSIFTGNRFSKAIWQERKIMNYVATHLPQKNRLLRIF